MLSVVPFLLVRILGMYAYVSCVFFKHRGQDLNHGGPCGDLGKSLDLKFGPWSNLDPQHREEGSSLVRKTLTTDCVWRIGLGSRNAEQGCSGFPHEDIQVEIPLLNLPGICTDVKIDFVSFFIPPTLKQLSVSVLGRKFQVSVVIIECEASGSSQMREHWHIFI